MRKLLGLFLLLAPLALSAPLDAQERRFEITPHGGYRFNTEFDVTDRVFDSGLEIDEGFAYGLFLDIPLTGNLQLEILANRQEDDLLESGGLFGLDSKIAEIEITHVHVGVLGQFGSGQAQPFVSGTVGVARLDINSPGFNSEDRFAASVGGGVKVFVGNNFGFRIEGRVYFVDLDETDDDFFDRYEDENSLTQGEASFGFIFAF